MLWCPRSAGTKNLKKGFRGEKQLGIGGIGESVLYVKKGAIM